MSEGSDLPEDVKSQATYASKPHFEDQEQLLLGVPTPGAAKKRAATRSPNGSTVGGTYDDAPRDPSIHEGNPEPLSGLESSLPVGDLSTNLLQIRGSHIVEPDNMDLSPMPFGSIFTPVIPTSEEPSSLTDSHKATLPLPPDPFKIASKSQNPKSLLHERYQKNYKVELKKDGPFVTWRSGPDESPRFAAVFVCPCTGEVFASGPMYVLKEHIRSRHVGFEEQNIAWYKTKQHARTAAAARAMDCFRFRRSSKDELVHLFCASKPHRFSHDAPQDIPTGIPEEEKIKIRNLQRSASFQTV